jgi:hypothetical protein
MDRFAAPFSRPADAKECPSEASGRANIKQTFRPSVPVAVGAFDFQLSTLAKKFGNFSTAPART